MTYKLIPVQPEIALGGFGAFLLLTVKEGIVSAPSKRLGGRRSYYLDADLPMLAEQIARRRSPVDMRRAEGLRSLTELATACGVSHTTIMYHISRGRIPSATRTWPGCPGNFYTLREVDEAKRLLDSKAGFMTSGGPRGRKSKPAA